MKIFVDFEATQPGNEIIEIGAVADTGEEFHTYVYPLHSKITPFIENLTGITSQLVEDAPLPHNAFGLFRSWVDRIMPTNSYGDIEFLAYGDTDKIFLNTTINNNKNSAWDNYTLGFVCYMAQTIIDYSKTTKRFFNTKISLIKAFNYVKDMENKQRHAALEDAVMLRTIFNSIDNQDPLDTNPFANVRPEGDIKDVDYIFPSGVFYAKIDKAPEKRFENVMEAVDFAMKMSHMQYAYKDRVAKNIMMAIRKNKKYCNIRWRREK